MHTAIASRFPFARSKAVAYNARENSSPASTGTSQTNVVCLTDGMGPCIAVAVGGERMGAGASSLGAKVRVFHVFPDNVDVSGAFSATDSMSALRCVAEKAIWRRAARHPPRSDPCSEGSASKWSSTRHAKGAMGLTTVGQVIANPLKSGFGLVGLASRHRHRTRLSELQPKRSARRRRRAISTRPCLCRQTAARRSCHPTGSRSGAPPRCP